MESNNKPEIESEIKVSNEKGGGRNQRRDCINIIKGDSQKINIERTEIGN
jgi:hypothetical protein